VTARPSAVRLRAYRVGFGDCLLLTITYGSALPDGRRARHLLVDCGTAEPAAGGPSLAQVAATVAEHCEGRLDVVVATHRHRDHVSGFGDLDARAVLGPLAPRVVVRPWTDMPRRDGLDARSQEFASLLDGARAGALPPLAFDCDRQARLAERLVTLAQPEPEAESLLDEWGRAGRTEYATAGGTVDLGQELPAVTVQVLGPPGGEEVSALLCAARGSAESWLRLAANDRLPSLFGQPPAGTWAEAARVLADPGGAGAAEWLLRTLSTRPLTQGLEVVEAFGNLVHDTSAALLVTAGSRTLLLPGDARAAGWVAGLDRRLADVDVYKVSRHGDRAGTPRRLLGLWRHRAGSPHPLVSVLPTEPGVVPAVPDDDLLSDLAALGPVHRTDQLPDRVWWLDVEAPARGRDPFAFAAGPVAT
jgi:hypothetical protein